MYIERIATHVNNKEHRHLFELKCMTCHKINKNTRWNTKLFE